MEHNELMERLSAMITEVPARMANGIQIVAAAPDTVTNCMKIQPFHLNIHGILHGGYMLLLADCCAGLTACTDGRAYVTQSQNFNFIHSAVGGHVYAAGTVIHRGRTVVVVQVKVTDENGRLLGVGSFDMFALSDKKAAAPVE